MSSSDDASYRATAKRGEFEITFAVFTKNGKPAKVGNFSYEQADATCETGGPLVLSGSGLGTGGQGNSRAKVENKKFSKTYDAESPGGGEGSVKFTGEFKHQNTRVRGTMRAQGDFPNASASGCDTGKIEYLAE